MKSILSLIILLIICSVYSYASASQIDTLKDISTVAVYIKVSSPESDFNSLNIPALKKEIEKKLNEARIDTVEYKDWKNNIGGSYLYIKVIPSKMYKSDSYAVYINVELYQAVVLIKSRVEENKVVQGNTWSVGKLLNCKSDSINGCLSANTMELVDFFIKDFREVNKL